MRLGPSKARRTTHTHVKNVIIRTCGWSQEDRRYITFHPCGSDRHTPTADRFTPPRAVVSTTTHIFLVVRPIYFKLINVHYYTALLYHTTFIVVRVVSVEDTLIQNDGHPLLQRFPPYQVYHTPSVHVHSTTSNSKQRRKGKSM